MTMQAIQRTERPCEGCGISVTSAGNKPRKWCSPACRMRTIRTHALREMRPCGFCGEVITMLSCQRYCSRECNWKSAGERRRLSLEFVCGACGKAWHRPPVKGTRPKRCPACRASGRVRRLSKTEERRQRRLPVLHPNPSPISWLPAKHPARQPPARRTEWWKFLVSGPCAWCGVSFTGLAASRDTAPRYCSKGCARNVDRYKRGRFLVAPATRLAIYERDEWTCQLCSGPVDSSLPTSDMWAATLDHIVCRSWSETPDDSSANLRLAHRWCNSVRGDERYYTADVLKVA